MLGSVVCTTITHLGYAIGAHKYILPAAGTADSN